MACAADVPGGLGDPSDRRARTHCEPGARPRRTTGAAFIVFHDSTIEAIAEARPRSIAELRRVPGVGPTKLDRYGEEIIGVVSRDG
jgi:DNA helicase-2/ATP-dependent DNA helicase PcrA